MTDGRNDIPAGCPPEVQQIAEACNGTIKEVGLLPDGSGFATMSMPLPESHWIYTHFGSGLIAPPMPLRMGSQSWLRIIQETLVRKPFQAPLLKTVDYDKDQMAQMIRDVGRYAVKAATMNGTEMDFDPDALVQNLVVAFLGYWTETGLSSDEFMNPQQEWKPKEPEPYTGPPSTGNSAMPRED